MNIRRRLNRPHVITTHNRLREWCWAGILVLCLVGTAISMPDEHMADTLVAQSVDYARGIEEGRRQALEERGEVLGCSPRVAP